MYAFQDLPIELVQKIVKFSGTPDTLWCGIDKRTLCALRLVSKELEALVCPVLFAKLPLEFFGPKSNGRCCEIVVALATQSTAVFKHTTQLTFRPSEVYRAQIWTTTEMKTLENTKILEPETILSDVIMVYIFDAISALKNLRTIELLYDEVPRSKPSTPTIQEITVQVISALATLPSFTGFDRLKVYCQLDPSFTLKPTSNLTTLQVSMGSEFKDPGLLVAEIASLLVRSPDMTEISIGEYGFTKKHYMRRLPPITLRELFGVGEITRVWKLQKLALTGILVNPDDAEAYIQHFEHLASLQIFCNPSPLAFMTLGSICHILQQRKIFLKGVSTDILSDPLLITYLGSYSGLTELYIGARTDFPAFEFVEQVYMQVLPHHVKTLEVLKLDTQYRGEGSQLPTEKQFAELLKCQNLRILDVELSVEEETEVNRTNIETWYGVASNFPKLIQFFIQVEYNNAISYQALRSFNQMHNRIRANWDDNMARW